MKNEERGEREAENEERETGKRGTENGQRRRENGERRTGHKERGPGTKDRTRGTGKWKCKKKNLHQSSISKSSPILCLAPIFQFPVSRSLF